MFRIVISTWWIFPFLSLSVLMSLDFNSILSNIRILTPACFLVSFNWNAFSPRRCLSWMLKGVYLLLLLLSYILHHDCSFSSLLSLSTLPFQKSFPPGLSSTPNLSPSPSTLIKEQVYRRHQQNMEWYSTVMPGTYYYIKAGQGDPIGEKMSHKQARESETVAHLPHPGLPLSGFSQELHVKNPQYVCT